METWSRGTVEEIDRAWLVYFAPPLTARLEFFCDCALSETDTVLTVAYYTLFDCSLQQDKLVWYFKWLQLVFLTTFSRVEVSTITTF
ncbi:hypothetical protein Pmani_031139 [Petrolisthes manimaculis]|uniref:Uncharacterized protein n=1 Tax=Petrolisthes manimaculis TaxID=1843537 RepID=A0AAE1NW94_9EUCA|nr:hypothetical protein Pmani_031139 [Petrolisthes manimaculis]